MKKLLVFILVIAMVLSLSACSGAKKGETLLEKGLSLLHKQDRLQTDISEALKCFEEAAALGNDDACFLAGWTLGFEMLPQTGNTAKKAYSYFEKCNASKGAALIARGLIYVEGLAYDPDEEKALDLIAQGMKIIEEDKLVADTGRSYYCEALSLLGIVYLGSYTVDEDCEKAFSYFQAGADLSSTKSLVYTGYMYLNGWGVEIDYQKAMDCFVKANGNAAKEAMYYIGYMCHEGYGVNADSVKAFECFLEAAEAGHIYSMLNVSNAYLYGDGVEKNQTLSQEWYDKALAAGYKEE